MPDVSNMGNTYSTHSGIIHRITVGDGELTRIVFKDGLMFNTSPLLKDPVPEVGHRVQITINGRGNIVAIEEAK